MKLLTADEVKNEKDSAETDRRDRIERLETRERELIKKLSDINEWCESETERIRKSLAEEEERANKRKKEIAAEMEAIDAERRRELEPINEIREKAESLLKKAEKENADNERDRKSLEAIRIDLAEATMSLKEREESVLEKIADLDKREKAIVSEEQMLEDSAIKLAEKWGEYNAAILAANESLKQREKDVAAGKKANELLTAANEAEAARLRDERRAIQDTYIAIEQAKKHLNIKL